MSRYDDLIEAFGGLGQTDLASVAPEPESFDLPEFPKEFPEKLRERLLSEQNRARTAPLAEQSPVSQFVAQIRRGSHRSVIARHMVDAADSGDTEAFEKIQRFAVEYRNLQAKDPIRAATLIGRFTLEAADSLSGTLKAMGTSLAIQTAGGLAAGGAVAMATLGPDPTDVVPIGAGAFFGAVKGIFGGTKIARTAARLRNVTGGGGLMAKATEVRRQGSLFTGTGRAKRKSQAALAATQIETATAATGKSVVFTAKEIGHLANAQTALKAISVATITTSFGKEGRGEAMIRLNERGLDSELVRPISKLMGWAYGAIESFETLNPFGRAGPGAGATSAIAEKARVVLDNAIFDVVVRFTTRHGINTVKESFEEFGQELVVGGTIRFAEERARSIKHSIITEFESDLEKAMIEGIQAKPEVAVTEIGEIIVDGIENFKHALGPAAILGLIGLPANLSMSVSESRQESRTRDIQRVQDQKIQEYINAEFTPEEAIKAIDEGISVDQKVKKTKFDEEQKNDKAQNDIYRILRDTMGVTQLDLTNEKKLTMGIVRRFNKAILRNPELRKKLEEEDQIKQVVVTRGGKEGADEIEEGFFLNPKDLVRWITERTDTFNPKSRAVSEEEKSNVQGLQDLIDEAKENEGEQVLNDLALDEVANSVLQELSEDQWADFHSRLPKDIQDQISAELDGITELIDSSALTAQKKYSTLRTVMKNADKRVDKNLDRVRNRERSYRSLSKKIAESIVAEEFLKIQHDSRERTDDPESNRVANEEFDNNLEVLRESRRRLTEQADLLNEDLGEGKKRTSKQAADERAMLEADLRQTIIDKFELGKVMSIGEEAEESLLAQALKSAAEYEKKAKGAFTYAKNELSKSIDEFSALRAKEAPTPKDIADGQQLHDKILDQQRAVMRADADFAEFRTKEEEDELIRKASKKLENIKQGDPSSLVAATKILLLPAYSPQQEQELRFIDEMNLFDSVLAVFEGEDPSAVDRIRAARFTQHNLSNPSKVKKLTLQDLLALGLVTGTEAADDPVSAKNVGQKRAKVIADIIQVIPPNTFVHSPDGPVRAPAPTEEVIKAVRILRRGIRTVAPDVSDVKVDPAAFRFQGTVHAVGEMQTQYQTEARVTAERERINSEIFLRKFMSVLYAAGWRTKGTGLLVSAVKNPSLLNLFDLTVPDAPAAAPEQAPQADTVEFKDRGAPAAEPSDTIETSVTKATLEGVSPKEKRLGIKSVSTPATSEELQSIREKIQEAIKEGLGRGDTREKITSLIDAMELSGKKVRLDKDSLEWIKREINRQAGGEVRKPSVDTGPVDESRREATTASGKQVNVASSPIEEEMLMLKSIIQLSLEKGVDTKEAGEKGPIKLKMVTLYDIVNKEGTFTKGGQNDIDIMEWINRFFAPKPMRVSISEVETLPFSARHLMDDEFVNKVKEITRLLEPTFVSILNAEPGAEIVPEEETEKIRDQAEKKSAYPDFHMASIMEELTPSEMQKLSVAQTKAMSEYTNARIKEVLDKLKEIAALFPSVATTVVKETHLAKDQTGYAKMVAEAIAFFRSIADASEGMQISDLAIGKRLEDADGNLDFAKKFDEAREGRSKVLDKSTTLGKALAGKPVSGSVVDGKKAKTITKAFTELIEERGLDLYFSGAELEANLLHLNKMIGLRNEFDTLIEKVNKVPLTEDVDSDRKSILEVYDGIRDKYLRAVIEPLFSDTRLLVRSGGRDTTVEDFVFNFLKGARQGDESVLSRLGPSGLHPRRGKTSKTGDEAKLRKQQKEIIRVAMSHEMDGAVNEVVSATLKANAFLQRLRAGYNISDKQKTQWANNLFRQLNDVKSKHKEFGKGEADRADSYLRRVAVGGIMDSRILREAFALNLASRVSKQLRPTASYRAWDEDANDGKGGMVTHTDKDTLISGRATLKDALNKVSEGLSAEENDGQPTGLFWVMDQMTSGFTFFRSGDTGTGQVTVQELQKPTGFDITKLTEKELQAAKDKKDLAEDYVVPEGMEIVKLRTPEGFTFVILQEEAPRGDKKKKKSEQKKEVDQYTRLVRYFGGVEPAANFLRKAIKDYIETGEIRLGETGRFPAHAKDAPSTEKEGVNLVIQRIERAIDERGMKHLSELDLRKKLKAWTVKVDEYLEKNHANKKTIRALTFKMGLDATKPLDKLFFELRDKSFDENTIAEAARFHLRKILTRAQQAVSQGSEVRRLGGAEFGVAEKDDFGAEETMSLVPSEVRLTYVKEQIVRRTMYEKQQSYLSGISDAEADRMFPTESEVVEDMVEWMSHEDKAHVTAFNHAWNRLKETKIGPKTWRVVQLIKNAVVEERITPSQSMHQGTVFTLANKDMTGLQNHVVAQAIDHWRDLVTVSGSVEIDRDLDFPAIFALIRKRRTQEYAYDAYAKHEGRNLGRTHSPSDYEDGSRARVIFSTLAALHSARAHQLPDLSRVDTPEQKEIRDRYEYKRALIFAELLEVYRQNPGLLRLAQEKAPSLGFVHVPDVTDPFDPSDPVHALESARTYHLASKGRRDSFKTKLKASKERIKEYKANLAAIPADNAMAKTRAQDRLENEESYRDLLIDDIKPLMDSVRELNLEVVRLEKIVNPDMKVEVPTLITEVTDRSIEDVDARAEASRELQLRQGVANLNFPISEMAPTGKSPHMKLRPKTSVGFFPDPSAGQREKNTYAVGLVSTYQRMLLQLEIDVNVALAENQPAARKALNGIEITLRNLGGEGVGLMESGKDDAFTPIRAAINSWVADTSKFVGTDQESLVVTAINEKLEEMGGIEIDGEAIFLSEKGDEEGLDLQEFLTGTSDSPKSWAGVKALAKALVIIKNSAEEQAATAAGDMIVNESGLTRNKGVGDLKGKPLEKNQIDVAIAVLSLTHVHKDKAELLAHLTTGHAKGSVFSIDELHARAVKVMEQEGISEHVKGAEATLNMAVRRTRLIAKYGEDVERKVLREVYSGLGALITEEEALRRYRADADKIKSASESGELGGSNVVESGGLLAGEIVHVTEGKDDLVIVHFLESSNPHVSFTSPGKTIKDAGESALGSLGNMADFQVRDHFPTEPIIRQDVLADTIRALFPNLLVELDDGRMEIIATAEDGTQRRAIVVHRQGKLEEALGPVPEGIIGGAFWITGQQMEMDGETKMLTNDVIAFSGVSSDITTVRHEVMGWVASTMLTQKERESLQGAFPSKPGQAEWEGVSRAFENGEFHTPLTLWGKVFRKIRRFFEMLLILPVSAEGMLRDIADGTFKFSSSNLSVVQGKELPPRHTMEDASMAKLVTLARDFGVNRKTIRNLSNSRKRLLDAIYGSLHSAGSGEPTIRRTVRGVEDRKESSINQPIGHDGKLSERLKGGSAFIGRTVVTSWASNMLTKTQQVGGALLDTYKAFTGSGKKLMDDIHAEANEARTKALGPMLDQVGRRLYKRPFFEQPREVVNLDSGPMRMPIGAYLYVGAAPDDKKTSAALHGAKSLRFVTGHTPLGPTYKTVEGGVSVKEQKRIRRQIEADPVLRAALAAYRAVDTATGKHLEAGTNELLDYLFSIGLNVTVKDGKRTLDLRSMGQTEEGRKDRANLLSQLGLDASTRMINSFVFEDGHVRISVRKPSMTPAGDSNQRLFDEPSLSRRTGAVDEDLDIPDLFMETDSAIDTAANIRGMMVPFFKMRRMLANTGLEIAIKDKLGDRFFNDLLGHMDVAEGRNTIEGPMEHIANFSISRIAIIGLASPFTFMKMLMSFPMGMMQLINPASAVSAFFAPLSAESKARMKETSFWKRRYINSRRGDATLGEPSGRSRSRRSWGGYKTIGDRALDLIMKPDQFALTKIYQMAEADVRMSKPGLQGEAFYDEVEMHWRQIVSATQPMSDRDVQGQLLAGRRGLAKGLMFYGQRTQMINEMIQRADDLTQATTIEEKQAAARRMAWSAGNILVMNSFTMASIGLMAKGYREWLKTMWGEEDDEEPDEESLMRKYMVEMSRNVVGMFPFVSEVSELFYSPEYFGENTLVAPIARPLKQLILQSKRIAKASDEMQETLSPRKFDILEDRIHDANKKRISAIVDLAAFGKGVPIRMIEDTVTGYAGIGEVLDTVTRR